MQKQTRREGEELGMAVCVHCAVHVCVCVSQVVLRVDFMLQHKIYNKHTPQWGILDTETHTEVMAE